MGNRRRRKRRAPVQLAGLRVRAYPVLVRAVEEGCALGWNRAHKHDDAPGAEAIKAAIEQAVTDAIGEVFSFDEEEGRSG